MIKGKINASNDEVATLMVVVVAIFGMIIVLLLIPLIKQRIITHELTTYIEQKYDVTGVTFTDAIPATAGDGFIPDPYKVNQTDPNADLLNVDMGYVYKGTVPIDFNLVWNSKTSRVISDNFEASIRSTLVQKFLYENNAANNELASLVGFNQSDSYNSSDNYTDISNNTIVQFAFFYDKPINLKNQETLKPVLKMINILHPVIKDMDQLIVIMGNSVNNNAYLVRDPSTVHNIKELQNNTALLAGGTY